jgi:uncharacterized SAM-binding protein YcdF (DUF218 family)
METMQRIVEIIISPLGIVTFLIASGVVLSALNRNRAAGRRFLVWGGLLFLIFLVSPLAEYLMLGLERIYPPMVTPPQSPGISRIVMLAGYAEQNPGTPITSNVSEQTIYSLAEGFRLYRLVPGAKLILSGGVAHQGKAPVAAMMADFLQQMGVPAQDLIVEGKSRNTYENLIEVRKLVGPDPFILVATACDLRRSVAVAHKLQMTPYPAPAYIRTLQRHPDKASQEEQIMIFLKSFKPSLDNLSRIQWAYHEYLGYIWYRLLNRV